MKRWLAGLMTHQYKKLPVTTKIWTQFNVMLSTLTITPMLLNTVYISYSRLILRIVRRLRQYSDRCSTIDWLHTGREM